MLSRSMITFPSYEQSSSPRMAYISVSLGLSRARLMMEQPWYNFWEIHPIAVAEQDTPLSVGIIPVAVVDLRAIDLLKVDFQCRECEVLRNAQELLVNRISCAQIYFEFRIYILLRTGLCPQENDSLVETYIYKRYHEGAIVWERIKSVDSSAGSYS